MKITIEGKYRRIEAEPEMALTSWTKGQPLNEFWMDTLIFVAIGEDFSNVREIPYEEALKIKELSVNNNGKENDI